MGQIKLSALCLITPQWCLRGRRKCSLQALLLCGAVIAVLMTYSAILHKNTMRKVRSNELFNLSDSSWKTATGTDLNNPPNIFLKRGNMDDIFEQIYDIYTRTCYFLNRKTRMWYLRGVAARERRGCQQTFPNVIVIGAKKCGTTALTLWLSTHPNIAAVTAEKHYFDEHGHHNLNWYRHLMPYSTEAQITMETTPKYFVYPNDTPKRIFDEISPETKIILILCDPVKRAISDYVHEAELNKSTGFYRIEKTFSSSVCDKTGAIDSSNELIDTGIYIKHLHRWIEYFPQMFVVDGTKFKQGNPAPTLIEAEKYLGLPRFFENWHFYVDKHKGNYCAKTSFPMHCLGSNKGRKHPEIEDNVLEQLQEFYRPYNQQVSELLNQTFVWA